MQRAIVFLAVLLALASAPAGALSERVDFRPAGLSQYDLSRESLVQLLCEDRSTGVMFLSRAIVLDLGPAGGGREILLAARHAVTRDGEARDCHVRGADADNGRIVEQRFEVDFDPRTRDFTEDWAVLQTRGRLPDTIRRLRVLAYTGEESGTVTMLRPGPAANCTIRQAPDHFAVSPQLIVHDCQARPGLSGSPIVAELDGEVFVIGLHVGQYLTLDDGRRYSVARRLSGDFLTTLIEVIEAARAG